MPGCRSGYAPTKKDDVFANQDVQNSISEDDDDQSLVVPEEAAPAAGYRTRSGRSIRAPSYLKDYVN